MFTVTKNKKGENFKIKLKFFIVDCKAYEIINTKRLKEIRLLEGELKRASEEGVREEEMVELRKKIKSLRKEPFERITVHFRKMDDGSLNNEKRKLYGAAAKDSKTPPKQVIFPQKIF